MAQWMAVLAAFAFCGAVWAEEGTKAPAKDGNAPKASLTQYEGAPVTPAEAAKLKAQGAHRWANRCTTNAMQALKKEIDILNLLNSLYLSEVQMRHLMVVAAKAEKGRLAALKEADAVNARREKAMLAVRQEMLKTGKPKCEITAFKQMRELDAKEKEVCKALDKQMVVYESYVKAILTDNQREKVYNYEHCLIPVKSLRDPARIGSPDSGSVNEKLLEEVRAMSPADFEAKKNELVNQAFRKTMYFMSGGDMKDSDRVKERDKMLSIFAKARSLNDLDFQFSKAKMAGDLSTDYLEVKSRLKEIEKQALRVENEKRFDGKADPGIFSQMFLDGRIIPLLAGRLRISEGFQAAEQVDLDKIEKAAACANGSCAID